MAQQFRDRQGKSCIKPKDREVHKRLSVYGLVRDGKKVLLVKPNWKGGLISLPGGAVKPGESLGEGLKREFFEETGLNISLVNKTPIKTKKEFFYADDIDRYFHSEPTFFLVEIVGDKEIKIIDTREVSEVFWADLDDLEHQKVNKTHLDVLKGVLK